MLTRLSYGALVRGQEGRSLLWDRILACVGRIVYPTGPEGGVHTGEGGRSLSRWTQGNGFGVPHSGGCGAGNPRGHRGGGESPGCPGAGRPRWRPGDGRLGGVLALSIC